MKKLSDVELRRELLLVVALPNANLFGWLCIPIRDREGKEHKSSKYSKRQYAIAHTGRKPSGRDKRRKPKHDHKGLVKDKKGFVIFHLAPFQERDFGKKFWIDFGQNIQFDDVSSPLDTSNVL
jgi:hypothetical protein